jgi:hypothetical protein
MKRHPYAVFLSWVTPISIILLVVRQNKIKRPHPKKSWISQSTCEAKGTALRHFFKKNAFFLYRQHFLKVQNFHDFF